MRAGLGLSALFHGVLLAGMARIEPEAARAPELVRMRLESPPPRPPEPPPREDAVEPEKPRPKPPEPRPKPPPPPRVEPERVKERTAEEITPEPPSPLPAFAVDMAATVAGGGVAAPAVEGGSNPFADPKDAKDLKDAPKEKVRSPPGEGGNGRTGLRGAYQITEEPRFLSSEEERTPPYPREAKLRQLEGVVLLRVYVNEAGRVADVRVLKPLGAGTDEIAAKWAKERWRFSPARAGAEAVGMWITVPVRFVLDR